MMGENLTILTFYSAWRDTTGLMRSAVALLGRLIMAEALIKTQFTVSSYQLRHMLPNPVELEKTWNGPRDTKGER
jgi:hypothetical protein